MHINQADLAHLSSALAFHAQWRVAVDALNTELANMYARWRDESLALAGLPNMETLLASLPNAAEIDASFDAVNGLKPVDAAA